MYARDQTTGGCRGRYANASPTPPMVSATAAPATDTPSGLSRIGGGTLGTVTQRSAAPANIAAMTTKRTVYPAIAITIGARMMKPTRNAPLNVNVKSEFATSRSRLRTIAGIVADSAGTKKTVIAATRKFTTYAAVTLSPTTSSGSTAAARNAFVTTSTRLRSVRSTTTPAKTPNTTAGR